MTESDIDALKIDYSLELKDWKADSMDIHINYTNPLNVGYGDDQVMTKLKNPSLFVSTRSGQPISSDDASSVKYATPQMPKGMSESRYEN